MYTDWCKNKQWRLCNLTNRFNFFVCPFRLKMTSKYIKIDQSSWSLIFLSHFFMYVFCDLRSQTAFHARKMKLFAFKDDLFMICTFFLLFFILNLRENLCIRLLQAIRFQRDSPLVGLAFLACLTLVLQYLPFQGSVLTFCYKRTFLRSTIDKCLECSLASFFVLSLCYMIYNMPGICRNCTKVTKDSKGETSNFSCNKSNWVS